MAVGGGGGRERSQEAPKVEPQKDIFKHRNQVEKKRKYHNLAIVFAVVDILPNTLFPVLCCACHPWLTRGALRPFCSRRALRSRCTFWSTWTLRPFWCGCSVPSVSSWWTRHSGDPVSTTGLKINRRQVAFLFREGPLQAYR